MPASLQAQILAQLNHDLRAPLAAISTTAEALREGVYGPLTTDQSAALQRLEQSAASLLTRLGDILLCAKVQTQQTLLHLLPVSAQAVTKDSLALVQEQARKKRIKLKLSTTLPKQLAGWGDEALLKSLLFNLYQQAIDSSPPHSQLELTLYADTTEAQLCWQLSGGNWPADAAAQHDLETCINPHWALLQALTDVHGGHLTHTQTTLTLHLPWHSPQVSLRQDSPLLLAGTAPRQLLAWGAALSEAGYQVTLAFGAAAALSRAAAAPSPLVITSDFTDLDTAELLRQWQACPSTAKLPVYLSQPSTAPDLPATQCLAYPLEVSCLIAVLGGAG